MYILVIEDNPADLNLVTIQLKKSYENIILDTCDTWESAKELLKKNPDCILLDLGLPDTEDLNSFDSNVFRQFPVVILTGLEEEKTALNAIKKGAQDYLVKGSFSSKDLCQRIKYAIERHQKVKLYIDLKKNTEFVKKTIEKGKSDLKKLQEDLKRRYSLS